MAIPYIFFWWEFIFVKLQIYIMVNHIIKKIYKILFNKNKFAPKKYIWRDHLYCQRNIYILKINIPLGILDQRYITEYIS